MIIISHYFTTVYHKLCKQHVMSVTVNYLLAVNIHNLSYLEHILDCKVKGINSVLLSFQARAAAMKNLYERQGISLNLQYCAAKNLYSIANYKLFRNIILQYYNFIVRLFYDVGSTVVNIFCSCFVSCIFLVLCPLRLLKTDAFLKVCSIFLLCLKFVHLHINLS